MTHKFTNGEEPSGVYLWAVLGVDNTAHTDLMKATFAH